ncbi:MAG: hypothetical protein HPY74_19590 [Firmicutes bacterium]|nr:hypothetical protein [Bacillota bacterium]
MSSENVKKIVDRLLKKDKYFYGEFKGDKDIIKEAQLIINNYIKECEKTGEIGANSCSRNKKIFKIRLSINTIINITLLGSIAVLLFFIIKLIL